MHLCLFENLLNEGSKTVQMIGHKDVIRLMDQILNLIDGLLGLVCQHDLFKCVQILNISNV